MGTTVFVLAVILLGYANVSQSRLVVNGRDAPPHAWPFQGALKRAIGGSHACGCVYLNEQYALTAAHCVDPPNENIYYVLFGTNTLNGEDGTPERRNLLSIRPHENFTNLCSAGDCFNHDIALLELETPLPVNPGIIEAPLLNDGSERLYHDCFLTGWGLLSGDGELPNWLQEAPFNVIGAEECRDRLGVNRIYWSPEYQVCCYDNTNSSLAGPAGPCYGDSGGPVHCRASENDPWSVVGLANWMIGECQSEYPSAWTNITYYRDWICEHTGDNTFCP